LYNLHHADRQYVSDIAGLYNYWLKTKVLIEYKKVNDSSNYEIPVFTKRCPLVGYNKGAIGERKEKGRKKKLCYFPHRACFFECLAREIRAKMHQFARGDFYFPPCVAQGLKKASRAESWEGMGRKRKGERGTTSRALRNF
jgi:hypothetical protein